ncbi:helix-turn-helix transcriptional regulator [Evansella halocellulosilytica]|uniref:helix-turn-helix transcriptional regulator n=1 Tax=Evansella halocellulosilytica TaxID=2011013 RepID=UPI000BB6B95C|nr:helix-turn-helix transcriptional regulator [Evansella halocellulosilytica]
MLGKVLKYNRIKQQKKQEEVCEGICSISYYSKIENDQIEPSAELVYKLMDRLNIDEGKLKNQDENKVKDELIKWGEALVEKDKDEAYELYFHLQEKIGFVKEEKISLLYKIFYSRYCCLNEDFATAKEMMEKIEHDVYRVNDVELYFYFYKCQVGYLDYHGNYAKAKEAIETAEKYINYAIHPQIQITDLYFMAGLFSYRMHNDTVGIYYMKKALQGFESIYNYTRSAECHITMGLCYRNLKQGEEAKQHYSYANKIAKQIKDESLQASVLHNTAQLYQGLNDPFKAIQFFQMSYRLRNGEERLVSISGMLDEFYKLGHEQEMLTWIEHGFEIIDDVKSKRQLDGLETVFYYRYLFYRVLIDPKYKKDFEKVMTEIIIPYFEDKERPAHVAYFAEKTAEYFEEKEDFTNATVYYKKAYKSLYTIVY